MSPGPIQLDQATALTLMLGPNGSVGIQASIFGYLLSVRGNRFSIPTGAHVVESRFGVSLQEVCDE